MKRYEVIDHTADIGIRAYGRDLKELFVNAAYGMFSVLVDFKDSRADQKIKVELKAPNIEELFLSWLSELLYQFNAREIVIKSFLINRLDETFISADVQGELLDLSRHGLKMEIKAATYHQLSVRKIEDVWQGEVIFDV